MRIFDSMIVLFFMAFIPSFIVPTLFPSLRLTFFAPFLIIAYYKKDYLQSMWLALFCGVLMDIFSSQARFGLYAVNFCVTTWFMYGQKRHFFEDSLTTLPIMTFLFSIVSTIIQVVLFDIFERGITVTWSWVGTDLLLMPLMDAVYAFVWFSLPRAVMPSYGRSQ